tara:strand:- start:226 stop:978 length:753 start_codon:yes stop_codon:yes gene_type:complete
MKDYPSKKIFLLVFLIITSCNLKRDVTKSSTIDNVNIASVIEKFNKKKFTENWISIKTKIKLSSKENNLSISANIKIRQDSLIWASITAPIIGEVSRVMISQDSLYYINRANSTWMIQPIIVLNDLLKTDVSYSIIQQIITTAFELPKKDYTSSIIGSKILIANKNDSNYYIINAENNYVEEINISLNKTKSLKVRYSGLQIFNEKKYPKNLSVTTPEGSFHIDIKYSNIVSSKKEKTIFNIPKSYNESK